MNNPEFSRISPDVQFGRAVTIYGFVNLYGCVIGDETRIGAFVEITRGAVVGARCKISSHSFICGGVTIEDEVFIGHGVMFTNDRYPRATNEDGSPQTEADWELLETRIKRRASIGSGAVILPGLTIGEGAIVGAGSVVTRDVPDYATVAGNPAKLVVGPASRVPVRNLQRGSMLQVPAGVGQNGDESHLVRERSG